MPTGSARARTGPWIAPRSLPAATVTCCPATCASSFQSIDHAILRGILARKLHDPGVVWLIDRILESGAGVLSEEYEMVYFPGDDLFAANRPRGLPIGNLTSQFWANCYLNPFDHFVKRELRCPAYLRYVDDLLLFGDDKGQLWDWKAAAVERLAGLRLTIHDECAQVRPTTEGIPFLGFVVYPRQAAAQAAQRGGLCPQVSRSGARLCRRAAATRAGHRFGPGLGQPRPLRRHPGPAPGGAEQRVPTGPVRRVLLAETPIFTKTFDFITWLMPVTNSFPRSQRFP